MQHTICKSATWAANQCENETNGERRQTGVASARVVLIEGAGREEWERGKGECVAVGQLLLDEC